MTPGTPLDPTRNASRREGHDAGERERVCAGGNDVLPAWGRMESAGRGCQGVGYGRYGGPLTPERRRSRPRPAGVAYLVAGKTCARVGPERKEVVRGELVDASMELVSTVRSFPKAVFSGACALIAKRPLAARPSVYEGRGPPIGGGLRPEPQSLSITVPLRRDSWPANGSDHGGVGSAEP